MVDSISRDSNEGIAITNSHLNPLIRIITWLLLAISSLMLGFRFLTRMYLKSNREFGLEDIMVILAFVAYLGQSVTLLVPASKIFGTDIQSLSTYEFREGLKVKYAGEILFFFCITFSKLSFCTSSRALSPDKRHRQGSNIIGGLITIWGLTVILVTAFQCKGNVPVALDNCINQRIFVRYAQITNALTDVILVGHPVWLIYPLQMPVKTRLLVLSFFSARLIVIVAIAFQVAYTPRLFTQNWTLLGTPYFISTEIIQFLSILTVCVTYFWPFMQSLRSGLMWTDNRTFTTQYALSTLNRTRSTDKLSSRRAHNNGTKVTITKQTEFTMTEGMEDK